MSKIEVNTVEPQCGTTLTLGGSGDTVALGSGASQTGFGRTGTVDWITTPKVTGDSPVTGVTGKGYFLNTTAGTITLNLPAGSAGDIVSLADYAATWQTNNVTVVANGSEKIGGVNDPVVLETEGQSVTLVYVDAVQGWINTMDSTSNVRGNANIIATGGTPACGTICGDYKIHTFIGPGTFCVSKIAVCAADNLVSYMVVAGGAGGGYDVGGGGGAGGYREVVSPTSPYTGSPTEGYPTPGNRITVTATGFPIVVGAGGAGGTSGPTCAAVGDNSSFSTITSAGGGIGGGYPGKNGGAGGSGGGGSGHVHSTTGGAGDTPPTTPAQGKTGGNAASPNAGQSGGGGGGATACGSNSVNPGSPAFTPRAAGATTSISATPTEYAQGGRGATDAADPPLAGGDNTGTGGDGAGNCTAGPPPAANYGQNGGSGIVIIRYKFK